MISGYQRKLECHVLDAVFGINKVNISGSGISNLQPKSTAATQMSAPKQMRRHHQATEHQRSRKLRQVARCKNYGNRCAATGWDDCNATPARCQPNVKFMFISLSPSLSLHGSYARGKRVGIYVMANVYFIWVICRIRASSCSSLYAFLLYRFYAFALTAAFACPHLINAP